MYLLCLTADNCSSFLHYVLKHQDEISLHQPRPVELGEDAPEPGLLLLLLLVMAALLPDEGVQEGQHVSVRHQLPPVQQVKHPVHVVYGTPCTPVEVEHPVPVLGPAAGAPDLEEHCQLGPGLGEQLEAGGGAGLAPGGLLGAADGQPHPQHTGQQILQGGEALHPPGVVHNYRVWSW